MTAAMILEMINSVDPKDTETLDEIDARVYCLRGGKRYRSFERTPYGLSVIYKYDDYGQVAAHSGRDLIAALYTRSRDALKCIRPMAFAFTLTYEELKGWKAEMTWVHDTNIRFVSPAKWSEEIAELHAVVQAIRWEHNEIPRITKGK